MASIGSLNVILGADAAPLVAGIAKAEKTVGGFAKKFAGAGMVAAGAFAAASTLVVGAAAAAGGAFVAFGQKQAGPIDATAKAADRLGLTTEALIGLRHGADMAGVGAATLDTSLAKMTRGVVNATKGAGPAAGAIERLGLSAHDLAQMSPDQQLAKFADALSGVENANERAALAVNLFGESGLSMLNLLAAGSEGLEAARKEAERLGITFSRIDAAKVEMANDAMAGLRAVVRGIAQQIAINLAPYIQLAADKLTDFATQGEGAGQIVTTGFRVAARVIAVVWRTVDQLKFAFTSVRGVVTELELAFMHVLRNAASGADRLSGALLAASPSAKALVDITAIRALTAAVDERIEKLEEAANEFRTRAEELAGRDYVAKVQGWLDGIDDLAKGIADAAAEQQRFNGLIEDMPEPKSMGEGGRDANALIRANSAEGQALAFASRSIDRDRERVQKDQLRETVNIRQFVRDTRDILQGMAARQDIAIL